MTRKKKSRKNTDRGRLAAKKPRASMPPVAGEGAASASDRQIREAFQIHRAGDPEAAMAMYRKILNDHPDHPDALHLLGVALYQKGDFEGSEALIRRAISRRPEVAFYHSNRGNSLKAAGRPEEAVAAYREAIRLDPEYTDALLNLGVTLTGMGKHTEALEVIDRALAVKPDYTEAIVCRGNTLRALGRPADALSAYERALSLNPEIAEAHGGRANALKDLGRFNEALDAFRSAIRLNPGYAEGFNNLGNLFKDMGKTDDATACYRRAVLLRPDYLHARINLANVLNDQGEIEAAISSYRKARELQTDSCWAAAGEAKALMKRGDFDGARDLIGPLVEAGTDNYDIAVAYAQLARRFHHHEEAIGLLERILSGNPADQDQLRQIHFSLGGLLDRVGRHDEAFDHYRRANRLRPPRFDARRHELSVTSVIRHFGPDYPERYPRAVNRSEIPVFIVGMPRSGTSLVEQILASHPSAFGAGELPDIPKLVRDLQKNLKSDLPYPGCLAALTSRTLDALAQHYLKRLKRISDTALRITDKMPQNFFHIGMLSLMFPAGRIIHCTRNPIDTALSIYFQNFSGGLAYAFDLDDIAFYYRQYLRLMAHWRQVPTLPILEVRYEDLVDRQEAVSREMFEFIDLPWDDRCLEFHKARRDVGTASFQQVREPIYRDSIGRWRHYESHIGPLLAGLGEDHVPA